MSKKDNGGPAFPRQHVIADANDQDFKLGSEGMTLRDYFASKALMGLISSTHPSRIPSFEEYAKCAYEHADEMIKQRSK